jgi:hypothetical protein
MTDLLEVIETSPGPVEAPAPPRRGRWVWVVFAVGLVGFALAVPVRIGVARSEVVRLEGQWRSAQAVDVGLDEVVTSLGQNASPADAQALATADSAADREAVADLQRISASVAGDLIVDGGARRLRQAVALAVSLDIRRLGVERTGFQPAAMRFDLQTAQQRVKTLLAGQSARFSLKAQPDPRSRHFVSVDAAVGRFGHILDQRQTDRLLIGSPSGLSVVDLDRDTVASVRASGVFQTVDRIIPRQGWVAVTTIYQGGIEQLYSVPTSLQGQVTPVVPVANGPVMFAGTRPDTVWVQRPDGLAVEVDGAGRTVTGPVRLPGISQLEGVVDGGLVLAGDAQPHPVALTVWDPLRQQVVRVIDPAADVVTAAHGDTVVWVTSSDALRVTTVSTGAVLSVVGPSGASGGQGALSPDGRFFATSYLEGSDKAPLPAIIDIRTGAVRLPRQPAGDLFDVGGLTWTAKGDRLYFTASHGGFSRPNDALVWPLAGDEVSYLRLKRDPVLAIAAL